MKILLHDYAGHPFQVQLSRALAARGHKVLHLYSGSNLTPQGALRKTAADSPNFMVEPIVLGEQVQKGRLFKRRGQEIQHGRYVVNHIRSFAPDIVISANCPLDPQKMLQDECRTRKIPVVYWLQDLVGLATHVLLKDRLPVIGGIIGRYYMSMEKHLLRDADAVVVISEDFADVLKPMNVDPKRVAVIENWAPLEEMPVRSRYNDWTEQHDLDKTFNFIYSGTLGMKHNPALLVRLAELFQRHLEVRITVISEGPGRKWLEARKAEQGLDNLILMDFQPFAELPNVLGSADVLVAILEPSAGIFSVPSKVMSYMCAQRPMLLAVPPVNLAARTVVRNETGFVCPPEDEKRFQELALKLYKDADLRAKFGDNARAYAERTFDIGRIATRFEHVFAKISPEFSLNQAAIQMKTNEELAASVRTMVEH